MARTHVSCGIALCVALLCPGVGVAGDVFTGYQIDNHGQYYTYLGVRTSITSGESASNPSFKSWEPGSATRSKITE